MNSRKNAPPKGRIQRRDSQPQAPAKGSAGGKPSPKPSGRKGGQGAGGAPPIALDAMGAPIRPERGAYFLYGFHPVRAALANPDRRVGRLWCTRQAAERLVDALDGRDLTPRAADRAVLDSLLGGDAVHQGVVLEAWPLPERAIEDVSADAPADARILVLDQVTDPHNVGAILRTAAVLGAQAVCLQDRNAPPESAVLAKSASGALEQVPLVRIGNLARALDHLKDAGFWIAGLDGEATDRLADLPRERRLALVLGAEGEGLRRLTRETCDMLVAIPMRDRRLGSLNVSNAAAVALYAALPD
ncbi:MAG: 23S rRNA (guanosine(2251)-2'-O)-methyltransferase RlmB [Marivibrio sp.]|uniref:23S rRNA (guanosine(2251)-2'-O)-methyltransferase RlmB n=1 Tax=Marivibrio sp. TaxID=2039719 RepID=UPI0032EC4EAD